MALTALSPGAVDLIPMRHVGRLLAAIERAQQDHRVLISVRPHYTASFDPEPALPDSLVVEGRREIGVHVQTCTMRVTAEAVKHTRGNVLEMTVQQVVDQMNRQGRRPGPPHWPTGNPHWPRRVG